MHGFDLNYDVLTYLMAFLDIKSLRQVAATCSLLLEISTVQIVHHVTLGRSLEQVESFSRFMLSDPTRILSLRSLLVIGKYAYTSAKTGAQNTVFAMLALVLEQAVNLSSINLYSGDRFLGYENISRTLATNGTRITEMILHDPSLEWMDLREVFREFQGSLRRLHLTTSYRRDFGHMLEPLQGTLEVLALDNMGKHFEFPTENGRQWPRVSELFLCVPSCDKLQLLHAFPNLHRLRVEKGWHSGGAKTLENLGVCRSTAAWTHLGALRGDLERILSLGLRGRIARLELSHDLSAAFIRSGSGTYLDFLKTASPRYLSLSICSDQVATIYLDPQLPSAVPELQYLVIVLREFDSAKIVSEHLPRMFQTLKNSQIIYLFISVIGYVGLDVSRELSQRWLPLLSNTIPSLQYVGFGLASLYGQLELGPMWYRVRVSRDQPAENDRNKEVNECDTVHGVSRRVLENIDRDVAELLERQCLCTE